MQIKYKNTKEATNLKPPTITKKSKAGKMIQKNTILNSMPFESLTRRKIRKKFNEKKFNNLIEKMDGNKKYIISGTAKVALNVKSLGNKKFTAQKQSNRKFSFQFRAKPNLTNDRLQALIFDKLQKAYQSPKYGKSDNELLGLSFNSYEVDPDYKYTSRVKLFDRQSIILNSLNKVSENIKMKNNCVLDYLNYELRKFYKTVSFDKLKKQLNEFCIDIIKYGCTIDNFINFIRKYYKTCSYNIIGPDFKTICSYNADNKKKLIFYVNNSHLYPITNLEVQKYIQKNTVTDYKNYFNDLITFEKTDNYIYMEDENMEFEEGNSYILNKKLDITEYLCQLIEETNTGIEYIDISTNDGQIKCFKHPTKDVFIYNYNDYCMRQSVSNKLKNILNNSFNEFKNQSFPELATTLLNNIATIPKSYYNRQSYYYLNEYETKPIIDCNKNISMEKVKGIDAYKQYSTIFFKYFQKDDFYIPVYDIHHKVKKYDNSEIKLGEYYIKEVEYNNIKFGGYFIHSFVIDKLLNANIIKKSDILYMINTKKRYKPTKFKKFVEITSQLNNDEFKNMNNFLNGCLKNSKSKFGTSHFTNDINTLAFFINDCEINNKKYSWNYDDKTKYSFIKTYTEQINYENTSSFYRATLSCSILQTLKLINKMSNYGEIVKVRTDAVYYIPNKEYKFKNKLEGIIPNLGKFYEEEATNDLYESRYTAKEFKKYEEERKPNKLLLGCGGSGKSYSVIKDLDENKKTLLLSLSNNAVLELKNKAVQELNKNIDNWTFNTFAYFFVKDETYNAKLNHINEYKYIVVDEVFMTSPEYMRVLMNCDSYIYFLGDNNQLHPIFNSNDEAYDMINLFDDCNIEYKEYNSNYGRYNQETYDIIEKFKKSGLTKDLSKLPRIDDTKVYNFYLCSYNETRKKYTKKCCDYFHKNDIEYTFIYNKNEEKYKIGCNAPIIATTNFDKKLGIFNNWKGKLKSITKKEVIINGTIIDNNIPLEQDITIPLNEFLNNFLPLYCSTVHKFQGGKIKGDYAILDVSKYGFLTNRNMFYTALTRCTNYNQIHIPSITGSGNKIIKKFNFIKYPDNYIDITYKEFKFYFYKILNENNNKIIALKEKTKELSKYYKFKYRIKGDYKLELLFEEKTTEFKASYMIKNLQINNKIVKNTKKEILNIYKEIIPIKKVTKVYINEDNIRYIYYDDMKKVDKKIYIKKKGIKYGIDFINALDNNIELVKTKNSNIQVQNNKLILAF